MPTRAAAHEAQHIARRVKGFHLAGDVPVRICGGQPGQGPLRHDLFSVDVEFHQRSGFMLNDGGPHRDMVHRQLQFLLKVCSGRIPGVGSDTLRT
jgi:hypothetical protein